MKGLANLHMSLTSLTYVLTVSNVVKKRFAHIIVIFGFSHLYSNRGPRKYNENIFCYSIAMLSKSDMWKQDQYPYQANCQ